MKRLRFLALIALLFATPACVTVTDPDGTTTRGPSPETIKSVTDTLVDLAGILASDQPSSGTPVTPTK